MQLDVRLLGRHFSLLGLLILTTLPTDALARHLPDSTSTSPSKSTVQNTAPQAALVAVCATDTTVCSTLSSTQCIITQPISVTDGCHLNFGTRQVVLEPTGSLSFPGGHIRLSAGALQLKSGSRMLGTSSTGPGGTIAITLSGQNCMTGSDGLPLCLDSAGKIDVSSTLSHGGGIAVQVNGTGASRLTSTSSQGDWLARSSASGAFRGSISIRTEGSLSITAALSTRSNTGGAGGFIGIESKDKLSIDKALDVSSGQFDGGDIIVRAYRDLTLGSASELNATGGTKGGDGGTIVLESPNEIVNINGAWLQSPIVLNGIIRANGNAPTGSSADGGKIFITGAYTLAYRTGSISASGIGDLGKGGTVSMLSASELSLGQTTTNPDGTTTTTGVPIDVRARGTSSGPGGIGGSIELKSQGSSVRLWASSATLNATSIGTGAVGGSIHLYAHQHISQYSPLTVSASGTGSLGGAIKLQAGGNIVSYANSTANGAAQGGFIDLWAGASLTVEKVPATGVGAVLTAAGTGNGNGGMVLLEANTGTLRMKGTANASGAGSGTGGGVFICGATLITESTAVVRSTGTNGANYFALTTSGSIAGAITAGNSNYLYYKTSAPTVTATISPPSTPQAYPSLELGSAALPSLVDGGDGKGGRSYDYRCPLEASAPADNADILEARTLTSPSSLTSYKVALSDGGQSTTLDASGTVEVSSDTLEIRFKSPVRVVGFNAWNGTGPIAAGSEANLAKPLLLELTASFALDATPPLQLRFWTYQGLNWFCSGGGCGPLNNNIGQVEGLETEPGFYSIGTGDAGLIREIRVRALNFGIDEGEDAPTDAWTVSGITFGTRIGNASCWKADADWRVVSQWERSSESFQHWLRTEQHNTHTWHTRTQTWEFNRYKAGTPVLQSVLQGSGASGYLRSPAVQLEVPYVEDSTLENGGDKFCDLPGQRDWASLFHLTHFHFQGMHETEDTSLGDPGPGATGNAFNDALLCNGRPTDATQAAIYDELVSYFGDNGMNLNSLCAAYRCCKSAAPIVDSTGKLLPALVNLAPNPAVASALLHPVCGASCLQTMQYERDACVPRPDAWAGWGADDERLIEYSLDNGKTWRRFNWMKDRYHGGYPGKWHYNHGHALQDGDGMLLMDEMTGFDWDQDGVMEMSDVHDLANNDEWDKQFRLLLDPTAPAGDYQFKMPAMRVRFLFMEDGNGAAQDRNGDGLIAGWRVDDVTVSNYEEWVDPRVRFFDGTGEFDASEGFFFDPATRNQAKNSFNASILSYLKATPVSCDAAQTGNLQCEAEWTTLMDKMEDNRGGDSTHSHLINPTTAGLPDSARRLSRTSEAAMLIPPPLQAILVQGSTKEE